MNLLDAAPLWLLIVFGCAMAAAAIEDGVRLRISNFTSLVVLATAVAAAVIEGPSLDLWQNAVVLVVILVLGTASFSAGLLGGGDVKLFAAAGLWFDLRTAVWFVVLVFLAGGLVAIAYLASRAFRQAPRKKADRRVPYGIAIAVGAIAMVLLDRGTPGPHYRALPPVKIAPHHP